MIIFNFKIMESIHICQLQAVSKSFSPMSSLLIHFAKFLGSSKNEDGSIHGSKAILYNGISWKETCQSIGTQDEGDEAKDKEVS